MRSGLPITNSHSGRPSQVFAYSIKRVLLGAAFCNACKYCAMPSGGVITSPWSWPRTDLMVGIAGSYFAPGQSGGSWATAGVARNNE